MYADRYSAGPAIRPGSLALALAGSVLPIAALVLGLQIRATLERTTPMTTVYVHPEPPPPPPDPQPTTKPVEQSHHEVLYVPPVTPPVDRLPALETTTQPPTQPTPPLPPVPGTGDAGTAITPVRPPVMIGAQIDPRYAGLLQPPYPSEERRAGREGRVVLRVLVGADGRVRQVERVSAASDAFYDAARQQALAKWRFKPATQDGAPVEQWKTMAIRFQLEQE